MVRRAGNRVMAAIFLGTILIVTATVLFVQVSPEVTYDFSGKQVAEVLKDPDIQAFGDYWVLNSWGRELDEYHNYWDGDVISIAVQHSAFGDEILTEASWDGIGVRQGAAPFPTWASGPYTFREYVSADSDTFLTWRGCVVEADAAEASFGVDLWFEVVSPSGEKRVAELFIFFFQSGTLSLPVGAKYVRMNYPDYSSAPVAYMQYHHAQLPEQGDMKTFTLDISQLVDSFKNSLPINTIDQPDYFDNFKNADWFIINVDCHFEIWSAGDYSFASGKIDYCSLFTAK